MVVTIKSEIQKKEENSLGGSYNKVWDTKERENSLGGSYNKVWDTKERGKFIGTDKK